MSEPSAPTSTSNPNRRRVLRIAAAAAGVPLLMGGVRALAPLTKEHVWRGEVLGALSELSIWHPDATFAQTLILKARLEIQRLEKIFSLYRSDSEIVRLNADGRLTKASPQLHAVIDESRRLSDLSNGAFDISVQPLWRLYEAHFWTRRALQPDIAARAHDVALQLVDYRRIDTGPAQIAFAREDMAITLNSIAQGAITDAVADLLRNEGLESAVVDLGEFRTLGRHPDGRPWRVGIGRTHERTVELENMALAVSGGYGTPFEPTGRFHHIFDPRTGASANRLLQVAVIAPRATIADGLATAIYAAGEAAAPRLLAGYAGARAFVTRRDGLSVALTATGSEAV